MSNAYRDENMVPTLIGVSSVDGFTPVRWKIDPVTGRALVDNANTGLTVGTTTITSGTTTRILYDNAGVLGEYTISGTGTVVAMATSPSFTTPTLGVATATSIAAATNASISLLSGTYNTIQTYTPSAAGTATLDLSKGNIHHITMPAGNITIALSNGTAGQCFIIRILQDAGGSRTVTWFTTIRWAGGVAPTLTTTASKADTLGFEITGLNTYDGFVVGQNI